MCGRFTLRANAKAVADMFNMPEPPPRTPRYNIALSQVVLALRAASDGKSKEWAKPKWGLVPSWADDPKIGYQMANARSETAATKPSFRSAYKSRRCIIPVDGYYEWKVTGAKQKQPYFFHRPNEEVFAFAGLWEHWQGAEGPPLETFCLLTTDANAMAAKVHDRMPVILTGGAVELWLDHSLKDLKPLAELLKPAPVKLLEAVPVSTFVNSPKNEGPRCVEATSVV
jgi:putative SOS response-associated peptidase YedK